MREKMNSQIITLGNEDELAATRKKAQRWEFSAARARMKGLGSDGSGRI
jgi:hypothetical protein